MTWSTRELADLAGTTVNTVRHYHQQGLLDEPEREPNGYKRYGVAHLVRLLQIRRLRDIGVPIARIDRVDAGVGTSPDVLRALDVELREGMERSARLRAEIADILENGAITEVPEGFARVAPTLTASERSLTLVYAQLFGPEAMAEVRSMVEGGADAATAEFEALPPDAGEATRARLAEEFGASIARAIRDHPWMAQQQEHLRRTPVSTAVTIAETLQAVYNEAQLDVLVRATTPPQG